MADKEYTCEKGCEYSAPLSQYTELYGGWYECPECKMVYKFIDIPVEDNSDSEFVIEFTPDETLLQKSGESRDVYLFRQELMTMWNIFIERRGDYGNHLEKGAKYAFDMIDLKYTRIKHSKDVSSDTLTDIACAACMANTFRELQAEE